MALTLQQQVRLMQNLLAVRIGTVGTRASKITTAGEALYSVYSGVSASVLWYFSTTGASPVLGGVSFTRTAGFWTICPIPEGFVPTHFKLDTEPGGWNTTMQAAGRIRLTAWWAREQEVNHIALAAAAGQPDTGFWRGDVQSVSIGGTVAEGGNAATSTASLERIGVSGHPKPATRGHPKPATPGHLKTSHQTEGVCRVEWSPKGAFYDGEPDRHGGERKHTETTRAGRLQPAYCEAVAA